MFQPLGSENRATSQRTGPPGAPAAKALDYAKLVGETLDARYVVTRKIGEGGMSFVYLADDVLKKEPVAIKVLSPLLSQDANAMARLRREAELGGCGSRIRTSATSSGSARPIDGLVYVVMPFVEGELLCDVTNRAQQLPLALTVRYIVRDMAAGLQVAHELGIVHRDLKPENMMICTRSDGDRARGRDGLRPREGASDRAPRSRSSRPRASCSGRRSS